MKDRPIPTKGAPAAAAKLELEVRQPPRVTAYMADGTAILGVDLPTYTFVRENDDGTWTVRVPPP